MSHLSMLENMFMGFAAVFYLAAANLSAIRLLNTEFRPGRFVPALIAGGGLALVGVLTSRGLTAGRIPLTDSFEFTLALAIVLNVSEFLATPDFRKGWFEAILSWLLLALVAAGFFLARPAGTLDPVLATPWTLAHGIAMLFAAAGMFFAAAMAFLFLICRRKLKRKQLATMFGKMPSIEKLENLNLAGLRVCVAALTLGIVSGTAVAIGQGAEVGATAGDWLEDSKILSIAVVWFVLVAALIMRLTNRATGRMMAYATIGAFLLAVFAVAGAAFSGSGVHNFVAFVLTACGGGATCV